jgi:hypothetical protein
VDLSLQANGFPHPEPVEGCRSKASRLFVMLNEVKHLGHCLSKQMVFRTLSLPKGVDAKHLGNCHCEQSEAISF